MTLEDLGNLGEFLGAIGVIVTLVYLAVQVRQNTRMMRANVRQARPVDVMTLLQAVAICNMCHPSPPR